MPSATETRPESKAMLWAGRILSALPALFLLTSGIHLSLVQSAMCANHSPGSDTPKTSSLRSVSSRPFLQSCTSFHRPPFSAQSYSPGIREEHPTWIVPVVTGVLLWIGLYLRDQTLRALVQHFLIQE